MRNNTKRFTDALKTYLKAEFTKRVREINEDDPSVHLPDVATWDSGFSAVLSGLKAYPGVLLIVDGRNLVESYFTTFNVGIGIGLTANDPVYLEQIGGLYEDILEDVIRSDWTLGGSCIDTHLGAKFESDCVNNVYLIMAQLECEVDLGGFVYEKEESGTDGEVSSLSEMHDSPGALPADEGSGVLPSVSQPDDSGSVSGAVEEESAAGLAAMEE